MLLESVKDLSNPSDMFFPSSTENQYSVEIDNDIYFNEWSRRSSIYLMNVVGALVKPKCMTNNSNNPSLVLKSIFHILVESIGLWWYPDLRLSFVNNL